MSIEKYISQCQKRVNKTLSTCLPSTRTQPINLHNAMRYATLNGGKRLRSAYIYAIGKSLGANIKVLDHLSAAIEMIHAFSLIHDDLPAIDNDDLRRGKPSCHKAFTEATAILAGDALQTLAFEIVGSLNKYLPAEDVVTSIQILSKHIGSKGLIGGESLDVDSTGHTLSLDALKRIYQLKTASLFCASILLSAISAGCHNKSTLKNLENFAINLGLAFQIHDDIIDIESSSEILGKPQNSDIEKNKITFPSLLGIYKAKAKRKFYYDKAINYLTKAGIHSKEVIQLSEYVVNRNY